MSNGSFRLLIRPFWQIKGTHPEGQARFSAQDDRNEAELARTALVKDVPGLISIVIARNGDIAARVWTQRDQAVDIGRILHSGPRLRIDGLKGSSEDFLGRQVRLFGEQASLQISGFRCGIAGGGANGSALLPMLLRLAVKEAVLFDRDIVDETNLNRLHGARRDDVEARLSKTAIHSRTVSESGLHMTLATVDAWAGEPSTWDAPKSCDVIFCCTDDHAGRLFLNRFTRFYGIPMIDVGLAMQRRSDTVCDIFARVSTLVPGHPCLLCGGYIDPIRAREESMKRNDPAGYEHHKDEAYVLGEGDPSPAVVTYLLQKRPRWRLTNGSRALPALPGKSACCRHACAGFTQGTNAARSLTYKRVAHAVPCPKRSGALA